MKKSLILTAIMLISTIVFLQVSDCDITVINPRIGDTWFAGQMYELKWRVGGWDCPMELDRIELVGCTDKLDVVLDTIYNIPLLQDTVNSLDYTPPESITGYPCYKFRFWGEEYYYYKPDFREVILLGTSAEFFIEPSEPVLPPLMTDPQELEFIMNVDQMQTSSKFFYVISNEGTIDWEALPNQSWISVEPQSGVSSQDGYAVRVVLTVDITGMEPGFYNGEVLVSEMGSRMAQAVLNVNLRVYESGVGEPELRVDPRWVRFSSQVGTPPDSQTITLYNDGTGLAHWEAKSLKEWVEISPSSGELMNGANTTITISTLGSFERVGSHRAFIKFDAEGEDEKDARLLVVWSQYPGSYNGTWTSSGDTTLTLPIVATNLPGSSGAFWSSDVHTIPLGSSRGTNHFTWGAVPNTFRDTDSKMMDFDMDDDYGTMLFDILGDYFQKDAGTSFVQVRGEGVGNMLLTSRCYTTDDRGWTYGQAIVPPNPDYLIGSGGGNAYVIGLKYEENVWQSNLFITEISGTPTVVTVKLYDENGSPTGNTFTETLEGFTQWQLTNVFLRAGSNVSRGYAQITTHGGGVIHVMGSVKDRRTNDPYTVDGIRKGTQTVSNDTLFLPAVVRAPGYLGTNWRSDFTLFNAGSSSVDVTVEYKSELGAARMSQVVTLPAGTQATYQDVLSELFGMSEGLGSLIIPNVNADTIFAYHRIYNLIEDGTEMELPDGSTFGQGYLAYKEEEAIGGGDGQLYILGLEQSPKFRSNVGVLEITGSPVNLLVTVNSSSGDVRTFQEPVLGNHLKRLNKIIETYAGFSEDQANVWVQLQVMGGSGKVIAYGSVVDNDSTDATFVKAIKK